MSAGDCNLIAPGLLAVAFTSFSVYLTIASTSWFHDRSIGPVMHLELERIEPACVRSRQDRLTD